MKVHSPPGSGAEEKKRGEEKKGEERTKRGEKKRGEEKRKKEERGLFIEKSDIKAVLLYFYSININLIKSK